MPENPNSRIVRVNYRDRETTTMMCEADTMACFHTHDGHMVLELTRADARGKPLEGWRFEFCPEDSDRALSELNDWKRRCDLAKLEAN